MWRERLSCSYLGDVADCGLEFGEELRESVLKGVTMLIEIADSGGEFDVVSPSMQAGAHAREGEADSIERCVRTEPIVHGHGTDGEVGMLRKEQAIGMQRAVDVRNELFQWLGAVAGPVGGEKVIEENIDEDGRIAAPSPPTFREDRHTGCDERMSIRESVDAAMESHAALHGSREGAASAAFDPVGGEIADEDGIVGRGENSMGELVHGSV